MPVELFASRLYERFCPRCRVTLHQDEHHRCPELEA